VVGVGVNVNNPTPLKTACSLRSLTGKVWELTQVLEAVLAELAVASARPPNPL
jgi:biotin-(acetyl-CoA carboxylase) ligase